MGINLLNKLGILVAVIGAIFFIRTAYNSIGAELKLLMLTILSLGAFAGGHFYWKKSRFRIFSMGLTAGGSVLLFFCAYAAYNVDATRVIPREYGLLGFAILLLVSVGIVLNTLRYDSEALTSFAYFMAFLAIGISIAEEDEFSNYALIAQALLAVGLITIISIKRWKFMTGLGLVAVYFNFFFFSTSIPRTAEGFVIRGTDSDPADYFLRALFYLLCYWLIFSVSTFTMSAREKISRRLGVVINTANAFIFFSMIIYLRPPPTEWGRFGLTAGMGVLYILLALTARYVKREHLWQSSILIGLGLLILAVPMRFSSHALVFIWLIQATILVLLGFILNDKFIRYPGYAALIIKLFPFFFTLPATTRVFAAGDDSGLFRFDMDQDLLYALMAPCFILIQIFQKRYPRSRGWLDKFVYQGIALPMIGVCLLLAYDTLQLPLQGIVLAPLGLVFLLLYHYFPVREHLIYGFVLEILALLVSLPLIFKDESGMVEAMTMFVLAIAGIIYALYLVISPKVVADMGGPGNNSFLKSLNGIPRLGAELLLVWNLLPLSLLVFKFLAPEFYGLGLAGPALLFLFFRSKFGPGGAALGVTLLIQFISMVIHLQDAKPSGGIISENYIFLINAAVLWSQYVLVYVVISIREGKDNFPFHFSFYLRGALVVLAGLTALFLFRILLPSDWNASAWLVYGFLMLGAGFYSKNTDVKYAALISQFLGTLIGPVQALWILPESAGLIAKLLQLNVPLLGGVLSFAFISLKYSRLHIYISYGLTLLGSFLLVFSLVPDMLQASAFAVLTRLNYYIISEKQWRGIEFTGNLAFFLSIIGFGYLLLKINDEISNMSFGEEVILGVIPLGVLGTALYFQKRVGGGALQALFRQAAISVLFAGFVILTMTLISASWWSLAWIIEAIFLLLGGLRFDKRVFRFGGFGLIALALGKIFLFDAQGLEDHIRIIIFIGGGGLIVLMSYMYARYKEKIFPEQERNAEDTDTAEK